MVRAIDTINNSETKFYSEMPPVQADIRTNQFDDYLSTIPKARTPGDIYLEQRFLPNDLIARNTDVALNRSITAQGPVQHVSYIDVETADDYIEVQITSPHAELPCETTLKGVIEDIMPSVAAISVEGTMIDPNLGIEIPASWSGSGFVIDPADLNLPDYWPEEGETLIATNHHVADGASYLDIDFFNRANFSGDAEVLISDEDLDIAILVVKTGDVELPAAPIGTIDDIEQGESIVAFGSPYGLPFRVTTGIINNAWFEEEGVIQTDAAINPGNSGGPMVDLASGNVVGMNTFIYRDANNMGFAIPIWLQLEALRDLWMSDLNVS